MARLLRVEYPGAIYHVTLRGNGRADLFWDDKDRERFLLRLGEKGAEYGVRLYLYCLMINHVHLVLETPQGNLRRFMHALETAYTVYFNLRHDGSGHVLQGRYGAQLVEGDEYLLKLSRYVHLNPVHVGRIKARPVAERRARLRRYPWSSYRGYAGWGKPEDFVDRGPVLQMMGRGAARQRQAYRKFVEAGLAQTDAEFELMVGASRLAIGSADFCDWIRDRHHDMIYGSGKKVEDAVFRRTVRKVAPNEVIAVVLDAFGKTREWIERRRRDGQVRPTAAFMLCKYGGMTQREAAERLGLRTGVAVSHQISRLKASLQEHTALRATVGRIDAQLAERRKVAISYGKG